MQLDPEEGQSTPRPAARQISSLSQAASGSSAQPTANPLRFSSFAVAGPGPNSTSTSTANQTPAGPTRTNSGRAGSVERRVGRAELLEKARDESSLKAANLNPVTASMLDPRNPKLREDILRLIEQYLGEEGYLATKLVLHDEAKLKSKERDERASEGRKLKRAILEGHWAEVDAIVGTGKPLVRTQNALLYALYKQQFLEHIEYRELQKAFTLLNKRLKPLEHFQPTPTEFKDLCYLLSAKTVHDAPSFKNWEGVNPSRAKLVEAFGQMVEGELEEKDENVYVPPGRLVTLLDQALAHQVETSRYRPRDHAPSITTLLTDFSPFVVPNSIANVLEGHKGNIKAVRFIGQRGERMLSGSSDNTVRVWDTATSACSHVLKGHTSRVWDVDSDARGEKLLSASGDRTVKVWKPFAEDGQQPAEREKATQTLTGNTGDVYSARWHPMGNHIASGGYDKIVRLFDVESGSILKTFTGHSLSISSVLFNPLGNLIVSGSKDSNVRFWDSVSGLCIKTLNAQLGEVTSVDMNDVYLLTSSRDNAIRLWDVRMLRPLRRFKSHSNTSQNFVRATFAHSSLLVSGSEDGVLYMWDRESDEVLQTLEGHEGVVYGAAWNDKQSLLASYGADGKIRMWDYDERKEF